MALVDQNNHSQLWVRPLDSLTAQPLAGTEGATYPFWSPDGRAIGFFAEGKLKRIESSGGAVQTICSAADGRGASWNRDGVIVFAGGPFGRLSRVAAAGGDPAPVGPEVASNESARLPHFLPDGRHLLFYTYRSRTTESSVSALDLQTGKSKDLFRSESEARFVPPGYLAYAKEKNLMVRPFDAGRLAATGEAVPIAEDVELNPLRATGNFDLAGTGLLVFESGGAGNIRQLTWLGLDGKMGGTVGDPAEIMDVSVSRDGRRAIVVIPGPDRVAHLWLVDLASGVRSRFTLDDEESTNPIWSPDGRFVAYTQTGQTARVVVKEVSDGAPPAVLFESSNFFRTSDWTPDGKMILFTMQTPETKSLDIWEVEVGGAHRARPLIASPRVEQDPQFSPDGKWLAYRSDEGGQLDVYVTSYPGPGGRWQISSSAPGGFAWTGANEIVFGDPRGSFAVTLTPREGGLDIGAPRRVLQSSIPGGPISWDLVSRRFLYASPVGAQAPRSLHIVTNWAQALSAK